MMEGIDLPIWDLRGCAPRIGEAALAATTIRERVIRQLQEHNHVSCLTLSQLLDRYDQAAWWIKNEAEAYFCLQRLLDLRQAVREGALSP